MSLIKGIKSGSLSKDAIDLTLSRYEAQKVELKDREQLLDKTTFVSKMNDIEMSISFAKLFVDNFSKIQETKV